MQRLSQKNDEQFGVSLGVCLNISGYVKVEGASFKGHQYRHSPNEPAPKRLNLAAFILLREKFNHEMVKISDRQMR